MRDTTKAERIVALRDSIRHWLHRMTHVFGWHHGIVTTWAEGGAVMVGFLCNRCGQVEGAHPIHFIPKQKVAA